MSMLRRAGIRLMRRIPGSTALSLARQWRDLDQLAEADVAFVSFPKSGRTFVRVMLASLYRQQYGIDEREALSFATLRRAHPAVPRIAFTHHGNAMRRPAQIRIDGKAFEGRKVVLLARHPGDIAVSRYFHLKNRSQDRSRQRLAEQPIDEFMWTPHGGVPSIVRYLNQWAELSRQRPRILIVRYEDFLSEPERTLLPLAEFVGLSSDEAAIREAVEFARFENLRAKEREGYFSSGRLGPGRTGDEQSFKVRSGKSGGFRTQLDNGNRARVEAYVEEQLDPIFGYGGSAQS
jgi:hypothetical protein